MTPEEHDLYTGLLMDLCDVAEIRGGAVSNLIWPMIERLGAAERKAQRHEKQASALAEALFFYAQPDTYAAIGFFPDRPCGDFMDDFSDEHDPGYPKPGKRARECITALAEKIDEQ